MLRHLIAVVYGMFLAKKWNLHESASSLAGEFIKDYKMHLGSLGKIYRTHKKGFALYDWRAMFLTDENYKKYLSTVDYYAVHPINGEFTKWIDDKLTLKYLCRGTELDKYFPGYYFLIDDAGDIMPLPDYESDEPNLGADAIVGFLREKGILCLKRIAGAYGGGIYKLEYIDGKYYLSGEEKPEDEIVKLLKGLRSYIVIEFLKPHPDMSEISPYSTPSIRYLSGRNRGEEQAKMLMSFVAYGGKKPFCQVFCYADADGRYSNGYYADLKANYTVVVKEHPDTGAKLQGRIPHWDDIVEATRLFGRHFPQLIYLGFDFVVTDKDEVKILEINSLSGLPSLQTDKPLYEKEAAEFYKRLPRR